MRVLFIGDIMGEPGRRVITRRLPKLIADHRINLVIGNAENAAGGFGVTPELVEDFFEEGFAALTLGNHAWDKKEIVEYIRRETRLLRPANYPEGTPGHGSVIVETPAGERVGIVQVMGRVYMPTLDCPFRVARGAVDRLRRETSAIVVDMHAEATSEKMAMGHYLDGQVTAVVVTHTHVQTADEAILPNGTAYITDIGMTGPLHSVIGIKKELAIEKFLTGMPRRFEVASGPAVLCAVMIEVDGLTGKALGITRVRVVE